MGGRPKARIPADGRRRRKLRLINPHSPLSTITMPEIIGKMTFSRRSLFMPLNLAICAAVILGGTHPSALPDEAGRHATIVCRGDAEATLPRALRDLEAGQAKAVYDWTEQPQSPIATPRKDLLDPADYLVFNPIQTTRGCPHGCTFCTTPVIFGRKFRQREIADIVEEVAEAHERYRTRVFIFSDDDVAGNHAWAMELFGALRPLKIRWASQCDILIANDDRLLTRDWDKYNGATVVFQPLRMTVNQLRHARMAAFFEFYSPRSMFKRLKVWPLKRNSYLANTAIYRGLTYYYSKRGRPAPRFSDFAAPDAEDRIVRSLGETRKAT